MHKFKIAVAALVTWALLALAAPAASDSTASLLDQLRLADPADAKKIEREIRLDWAKSGSPALDLLLKRGKDALEAGDLDLAIGHLTALTDHGPDFAEGWHTRAMAFFQQERYGLAVHDLERTLALNPDHFAAIYGLAIVFESLERQDEAYKLYQMVLALHPNHEESQKAVDRLQTRVTGSDL
ncbi:tetratricopeptide repeat protein [Pseudooceanicola sp.]|uniref:tetratricopeptide repeat protein n=1 Tax=Pseudooceanicola sp. TaxID=1914328 RepID=UPI002620013A|nr:tetratricopeptide repeat protein [Pseudooceanicola sp.]MDF1853935.1 tetratricopeptide repeat protein [Pseudooceanicola sp.]